MARSGLIADVQVEITGLARLAASRPLATLEPGRFIARLASLDAAAVTELSPALGQMPWPSPVARSWLGAPRAPAVIPVPEPVVAPLLIFHRSGFVRELSLKAIDVLPDGPFFVAALAFRLNDWAEPVRKAAEDCARRALPHVSPASLAMAAPFLLARLASWTRWGPAPPAVLLAALGRPDAAACLAEHLIASKAIPGRVLDAALRLGLIDTHLAAIARGAIRPELRATALRTIIDGEVCWLSHYERVWADKRFGITRRKPVLARRPIARPMSAEEAITLGAGDRNPRVRYVAAERLVRMASELAEPQRLAALFAGDRSRSVRWLMDFLARQRTGKTADLKRP